MKDNCVIFKGTKEGIQILLDEKIDYITLKKQLEVKIIDAQKFFKGAQMSIRFTGRILTEEQKMELLQIIRQKSGLQITFIHDEEEMQQIESEQQSALQCETTLTAKFYKGTVRSGQCIKHAGHLVILGDVNPGGMVIADGNVIVLGMLKGIAHAGANGDVGSFICALDLQPMQLRIAQYYTREPEAAMEGKDSQLNPISKYEGTAEIAYVLDQHMHIEPLDKKSINNLIIP